MPDLTKSKVLWEKARRIALFNYSKKKPKYLPTEIAYKLSIRHDVTFKHGEKNA